MAWLVTKTDKTTVAGFARTSWRTVGAVCERVAADCSTRPAVRAGRHRCRRDLLAQAPPVFDPGVRHDTGKIIWGKPGKDTDTLNAFFDELPDGAESIEAVSMDMAWPTPRRCGNARVRGDLLRPIPCHQARHRRARYGAPAGVADRPRCRGECLV